MKLSISICIAITLLTISVSAQLSGPLSGTLGPGTYTVIGNISVQEIDSLVILPGTDLMFNGQFEFDANGYLCAEGTETDSIRFMPNTGVTSWAGITFDSTSSDSCRLNYCVITGGQSYGNFPDNGGGGILVYRSNPTIEHCNISYNKAEWGGGIYYYLSSSSILRNCTISFDSSNWGGGIGSDFSDLSIESCIITNNWTDDDGGGIAFYESNPNMSHCTIANNQANGGADYCNGGGLYFLSNCNAVVSYCTISGNYADAQGGGINCNNASPVFSRCAINANRAYDAGGGINCCSGSCPIFNLCDICYDTADWWGGGISIWGNSHPIIDSCVIDNNIADWAGGIALAESSPTISHCLIRWNSAQDVGGIEINTSSPHIFDCTINYNSATDGGSGGINCVYDSYPTIENCVFNANSSSLSGGGLNCYFASASIYECVFSWNSSYESGGGINLNHSNTSILNCTVISNFASYQGGGIYLQESNPTISNTIVSGNLANGGIAFNTSSTSSITYCDFYNNSGSNFINVSGGIPSGLGTITTTNANSDPCDQYYNIFLDPQFVGGGDYHLTENSPCIDAGDPTSPWDPDSTVSDIGAYYLNQDSTLIGLSDTEIDFELVLTGNYLVLPLTIYSRSSHSLSIRSVYTTDTCFYTDFSLSDSLIAGRDSLELSVTFEPSAQEFYSDTLFIVSSAVTDTAMVYLLGDSRAIPDTVRNLTIQVDYPDAVLNWDRVTQTVYGTPVTIDYYLVFFEEEYNEEFNFLAVSMDTTYTHQYVAQFSTSMFYFVEAYVGDLGMLDELMASGRRMTRDEVHELLRIKQ